MMVCGYLGGWKCVCLCVCVYISDPRFIQFGQLLHCAHKRIVNIMKVYVERKNMQVELIRFRKKDRLYLCLLLRGEEFNATRVSTLR